MNIEVIKAEKDDVEVKADNLTVIEILRVYLNEQGIDFTAWRREHPSKPILFKIQGNNVKKAVSEAVESIKSDSNKLLAIVKKK